MGKTIKIEKYRENREIDKTIKNREIDKTIKNREIQSKDNFTICVLCTQMDTTE